MDKLPQIFPEALSDSPKQPKLPSHLLVDRNGTKLKPGDLVKHIVSKEIAVVLTPEEFDVTRHNIKYYESPTTVRLSPGFGQVLQVEPKTIEKVTG